MFLVNESSLFGQDTKVQINESNYNGEFYTVNRIIEESYRDMLGIVESMAIIDLNELKYRHEGYTSDDYYVTEGFIERIKGVFAKIKDFLKKLWEKIKTFFKNLMVTLRAFFMKADDFVKHYSAQLNKVSSKKVTVKGYKYTSIMDTSTDKLGPESEKTMKKVFDYIKNGDIPVPDTQEKIDKQTEEMKQIHEAIKSEEETILDAYRSVIVGRRTDAESFDEDLFKVFRDGTDVEDEITIVVSDAIKVCKESTKVMNGIEKAQKAADKIFSEAIKALNKMETKANSKSGDEKAGKYFSAVASLAQSFSSLVSSVQSISLKALNAMKKAHTERVNQAKAVCSAALRGKTDK